MPKQGSKAKYKVAKFKIWQGRIPNKSKSEINKCGDRWGVCSFSRRIRPSGSGPKLNFTKKFGSGRADPDRGGCRDPGIRYLEWDALVASSETPRSGRAVSLFEEESI